MDLIFLALVLSIVVAVFVYLTKDYDYWEKRGIPSVKNPLPGIGHSLPVITQQLSYADMCQKYYETYSKHSMVGFYDKRNPVLLVREPELVKVVLQSNFKNFHKNFLELNSQIDPLLAKNPFFSSGESWASSRKRLTYAFSNVRLKMIAEIVQNVCRKFEAYIDKKLQNEDKYEVELKDLFSRFTGEVVANAGLGIEGQCFEDDIKSNSLLKMSRDIFEPSSWQIFLFTLTYIIPNIRDIFPVSFLPKHVDKYFREVIKKVVAVRKTEKIPRNDFFQLMLEMEAKEDPNINEESLAGHVLSFFGDGLETSSITLQFIGYHLALNVDVQCKLRDEIKSVLMKHGGVVSYDAVKDMTYMNQVISESQRLEPALDNLLKICTEKLELVGSDGLKCEVKPGTKIVISNHGMHKDPQYWTDPDKFDPERFSEDRKNEITKYSFLPFGEGPRMCVGMRMALLQMKCALATLLNKYSIELSPKTRLPLRTEPGFFLRTPIHGVWTYIKPLKE